MKLKGIIKNNKISYGSLARTQKVLDIFKKNEGKIVTVEIDDTPSSKKRRFFEGPVAQFWFYQHPHSGWKTFDEARENLKLGYNPRYIKTRTGKTVGIPGSTKLSKAKFDQFLERVQDGFMENGLVFPDSEDYNKWIDLAPGVDEVYPPLEELITKYQHEV